MIGVDTNVFVRYVTNDDPDQARRAVELLAAADEIILTKTVALELEWVLRAVYRIAPDDIHRALLHIAGLPNITLEQPEQLAAALELYQKGMDFADALHLTGSGDVNVFYTFDNRFAASGEKLGEQVRLVL